MDTELEHWSSPNGCHPDCPACAEEEREEGGDEISDLVARLESLGIQPAHLDSAVHDAASERATAICNEGLVAQVTFLRRGSDHSWKPGDIVNAAQVAASVALEPLPVEGGNSAWFIRPELDIPDFILSKDGKEKGEVLGTRRCHLEGCTGVAYIVRWPSGRRTHPCTKSCKKTEDPKTEQLA